MDFTHKKNTTFNQRNFTIDLNGDPLIIESVKMHLRRDFGAPVIYEMSMAVTGVGEFIINEQIIDLPPLTYVYDIRIAYDGGTVKNWISGNFIIESNVTND